MVITNHVTKYVLLTDGFFIKQYQLNKLVCKIVGKSKTTTKLVSFTCP